MEDPSIYAFRSSARARAFARASRDSLAINGRREKKRDPNIIYPDKTRETERERESERPAGFVGRCEISMAYKRSIFVARTRDIGVIGESRGKAGGRAI